MVNPSLAAEEGAREQVDEAAFEGLVAEHLPAAYRLAFLVLHDRDSAEDAVQEAALRAWRSLAQLRGGSARFRPWFLRIVVNECIHQRRLRWFAVLRRPELVLPDPSTARLAPELLDLRAAIGRLPPRQRTAVILRYYLDLPVAEVAAVTASTTDSVKARLRRALGTLRPELADEELAR